MSSVKTLAPRFLRQVCILRLHEMYQNRFYRDATENSHLPTDTWLQSSPVLFLPSFSFLQTCYPLLALQYSTSSSYGPPHFISLNDFASGLQDATMPSSAAPSRSVRFLRKYSSRTAKHKFSAESSYCATVASSLEFPYIALSFSSPTPSLSSPAACTSINAFHDVFSLPSTACSKYLPYIVGTMSALAHSVLS